MSLIKAIKAQLGLSNTPANNFTITAEADNGTLKLARGNAGATTQDILTVDASGKVAFPQNAQTWQDVTATRALGTTYTNDSVQQIQVIVTLGSAVDANIVDFLVSGLTIIQYATAALDRPRMSFTFTVPAGATYRVNRTAGTVGISKWAELR